jgi:hypothetical protein
LEPLEKISKPEGGNGILSVAVVVLIPWNNKRLRGGVYCSMESSFERLSSLGG